MTLWIHSEFSWPLAVHQSNRRVLFNSLPDPFNGQTANFILKTPKVIESRNYVKKPIWSAFETTVVYYFSIKEVKEVPNTLNRLHESQMSSIFPKYAIVMFVINLRKSFLFMQGYKNCWKCYTIYTMIYKKWQIEVNGEKWYVEKKNCDNSV